MNDCICNIYCGKVLTKNEQVIAHRVNSENLIEFEIVRNLRHPNLLHHFGDVSITGSPLSYFIVENHELTLFDYRKHVNDPSEQWIINTFLQILDAVYFIHFKGYVHRNICAENILTFNAGTKMKISNFSNASFSMNASSEAMFSDIVQAPEYLSPETVLGIPYKGFLQDAWSTGIVLSYLISGRYHWDLALNKDYINFLLFKKDGSPFKIVKNKTLKDFLTMLLNVSPQRRSTVFGIVTNYIGVCSL